MRDGSPSGLTISIVVPTVGRPTLPALVARCVLSAPAAVIEVVVVDDAPGPPAAPQVRRTGRPMVRVVRSGGRGPAAARNAGWKAARGQWVAFVDDDLVLPAGWTEDLVSDLAAAPAGAVASQGRLEVPLPAHRPPTDWERQTAGLVGAPWITADIAYRRWALVAVGGFDESFPRAYREDVDLALRAQAHGSIVTGRRVSVHPVRPAPWWVSVARQAGNADDVRMWRKHGPSWRARAGAPAGRKRRHVATSASLALAVAARRRAPRLAAASAMAWAIGTLQLAVARCRPGPRDVREVAAMVATSAAIPLAATASLVGAWPSLRRERRRSAAPAAVLLDRDGTLVVDVPYNGDPAQVRPVAGARRALDELRRRGVRVGLISNQSAVGRGLITAADVEACNRRLGELVGPFDVVCWCPHEESEGCSCRKPAPGLVHRAADALGVPPARCVVIGDTAADLGAARRAGAMGILVPNEATRPIEVAEAPVVAPDLGEAVAMALMAAP